MLQRQGKFWRNWLSRFLFKFIVIFFSLIIIINTYIFTKYSSLNKSFFKKSELKVFTYREINRNVENSTESNQTEIPIYVEKQFENLKKIIPNYFIKVNKGTGYALALPIKLEQNGNTANYSLLTFFPLEWEFACIKLQGFKFSPKTAYLCNGFYIVEYTVRGVFPSIVERGNLTKYDILAVPDSPRKLSFLLFDSEKGCPSTGYVFNLNGDFSGVCSGNRFLPAEELSNGNCRKIYGEVEDGNLQG